jgi:hypothetical protein
MMVNILIIYLIVACIVTIVALGFDQQTDMGNILASFGMGVTWPIILIVFIYDKIRKY